MTPPRRDDNGSGRFATMLESIAPPPDRVVLDTESVLHGLIDHLHTKQRRAEDEIKRTRLGLYIASASVVVAIVAGVITAGRYMERVDHLTDEVTEVKSLIKEMRAEAREDRRRP